MNIIVCFVILIRSDCDMRVYFSIVTDAVIVATMKLGMKLTVKIEDYVTQD